MRAKSPAHGEGDITGAATQHQGRFERAHKGTIFLDEIGELDANLQAKLLRVLQERTLERVGGSRQIDVDVRVVAATNRDLGQMVREGRFREDLFYRLNLFPIALPALRHRPADILPLASTFFLRARRRLGKPDVELSAEAAALLQSYAWPGNVRELENVMERAAILSESTLLPGDLPPLARELTSAAAIHAPYAVPEAAPSGKTVRELEKDAIVAALHGQNGNRTRAAAQLGISLRTLQYRLKTYGISGV
ncbi:MAG: sigma 54-interacting transcriptional regulator [Bryobacterales bacterium]|nr:sigma 54-interacting transcriptional regulator [Bryobacterales bacterium]